MPAVDQFPETTSLYNTKHYFPGLDSPSLYRLHDTHAPTHSLPKTILSESTLLMQSKLLSRFTISFVLGGGFWWTHPDNYVNLWFKQYSVFPSIVVSSLFWTVLSWLLMNSVLFNPDSLQQTESEIVVASEFSVGLHMVYKLDLKTDIYFWKPGQWDIIWRIPHMVCGRFARYTALVRLYSCLLLQKLP